jgi:hypothetical protein
MYVITVANFISNPTLNSALAFKIVMQATRQGVRVAVIDNDPAKILTAKIEDKNPAVEIVDIDLEDVAGRLREVFARDSSEYVRTSGTSFCRYDPDSHRVWSSQLADLASNFGLVVIHTEAFPLPATHLALTMADFVVIPACNVPSPECPVDEVDAPGRPYLVTEAGQAQVWEPVKAILVQLHDGFYSSTEHTAPCAA